MIVRLANGRSGANASKWIVLASSSYQVSGIDTLSGMLLLVVSSAREQPARFIDAQYQIAQM
jgi:hypothetical protein